MFTCRSRGFMQFALIVSLLLSAGIASAKGKAPERGFDFAKTNVFMREMETRPDFPVGAVLANDYAYSLVTLGQKLEPPQQNAILGFLKLSQQQDGGFVPDKGSKTGNVMFSDLSLDTLSLLKLPNECVDTARLKGFLKSLKNPDGGFGFSAQSKASSLASTFYSVRILKRLNSLQFVDKAKTAAYVKGFAKKDGGFGPVKGAGASSARATYMASFVLDSIGALDEATRKSAVKFLASTPYGGSKKKEVPDLDEELHTILALKVLKAPQRIDRKYAMTFMNRIYIKFNGGFGPTPGYGSSPDSTTNALRVLAELGKVKTVRQVKAQLPYSGDVSKSSHHPTPPADTGHGRADDGHIPKNKGGDPVSGH